MKLSKLFNQFFHSEKSGGFILIGCTAISLVLANSGIGSGYIDMWHAKVGTESLEYWINDGLMAVFFLLIGLELEREIYAGELSSLRQAAFPVVGALGGMLVPAGIFLLINRGLPSADGAGIPMATDIAFALGILSLLGRRVPAVLKVFLTALAVIDDLGAILVIAIFYSDDIQSTNLFIALGLFALLIVLNRLRVHVLWPYLLIGPVMWWFMLHSGVHATITGVLLAFAIPFGNGTEKSISYKLQQALHVPVSFIILPLFALANTAILIPSGWMEGFSSNLSLGIIAGLLVGKPVGILMFCALASLAGIARLPEGLRWKHLAGAGMLAGIGFTMSIFITLLAFNDAGSVLQSKIAILGASLVAAVAGLSWLAASLPRTNVTANGE